MNRPPRSFWALIVAAYVVGALTLATLVGILGYRALRASDGGGLLNPQARQQVTAPQASTSPAAPRNPPSTATAPGATPTEAPGRQPAAAGASCAQLWQPTMATPLGPCTMPDGTSYSPTILDCGDGTKLVLGTSPGGTGLYGRPDDRLTAAPLDALAELAAQCQDASR